MIAEAVWLGYYGASALNRTQRVWRRKLAGWRHFWTSYSNYRALAPAHLRPKVRYLYPCLDDNSGETTIEPIYFYQNSWAFEHIVQDMPNQHVDVGSHHEFVALLSKVVPVTMIDIRPLSLTMPSIRFRKGSILELPYEDDTLPSVSSICVVEHIGLGRYGDPLDLHGTEKAVAELKRVLAPGGNLYISLPLHDTNRTYFNAHRAFSEDFIESLVQPLQIVERRYIQGNAFLEQASTGDRVGCYHLRKKPVQLS